MLSKRLDVPLQHPLVRAVAVEDDLRDGILCPSIRPEPVGERLEVALEDGLLHQFERRLHDPVPHRRDAQPSQLAVALRDHPFAYRQGAELPSAEFLPQVVEEHLDPLPLEVSGGDAVNTGAARAPIASDPMPPCDQEGRVTDEVVQVVELAIVILASPPVQLGLHPQYRGLRRCRCRPLRADVHRRPPAVAARLLRGRCLPSPCRRLSRPRTTAQTPPRLAPSAGDEPSRARRGVPASGRHEALPKFTMVRLTGLVASFAPATSPRVRRSLSPWPPRRCLQTASESPDRGRASHSGPYPPGWSRWILKGL